MAILGVVVCVLLMVMGSHEHGMLMDPVNRGSMWRQGYNTPINYDDNQMWCGGRQTQWNVYGGNCGECGDSYGLPRPRPSENGGLFGTGVVVQKYKSGSTIKTVTKITANHWGNFEFRLCPITTTGQLETEECFAKYPLRLQNGNAIYNLPNSNTGDFEVSVVLPPNLTCNQCVLQWTYVTANSWGVCANGTGAVGCGPQETFRTCSDISIY